VPDVISEVVLDDGLRIKVDGPLVLGRNPLAPDAYPDARSVQVTDETMRLSKTHLVLIPEGGHVQVIDIGATNGVYIEIDRERTRIPVHEPQRLAPGTLVHFGGRTLRLVS
jgi:FHA domain containing protein